MKNAKEPFICTECGKQIEKSYMLECEHCLSKRNE